MKALRWTPQGRRAVGHPKKRWADDIEAFMHGREDGMAATRVRFMWLAVRRKPAERWTPIYNTDLWRKWWANLEDEFMNEY